jgi:hypothetical protein
MWRRRLRLSDSLLVGDSCKGRGTRTARSITCPSAVLPSCAPALSDAARIGKRCNDRSLPTGRADEAYSVITAETMRRVQVCIYGGTDLQATGIDFISELAYKILDSMPAIIVTGGFLHSNAKPRAVSTDAAALQGARRYANARALPLKDCYEAWIPEPRLDSRPEIQGAVRMTERDGSRCES